MVSFFKIAREKNDAAGRRFVGPVEIKAMLERKYKGEIFPLEKLILIFDTASQHTWLASSDNNLLCVIDRRREDTPKVLWKMPKSDILHDGSPPIDIQAEETSNEDGYVQIGRQRPRKFSTSLFSADELTQQIGNML